MRLQPRLHPLWLALVTTLPHVASADATLPAVTVTAETSTTPGYNPLVSSSATKGTAALRDIPQTVNVVGEELMDDQGTRSLADALRNVPGVTLNMGDGQRDQFAIRGFTAIGDIYLDGVRDDALYFRDLSNIDRIEVIKGPAAVLYGRGSSGGIINRVSKLPTAATVREITAQADSEGERRASVDLGGKLGDSEHTYRLTGALEDSEGFRDESFLKRQAIAPSFDLKLGEDTRLLLQLAHTKDERPTDFGIPDLNGRPLDVPKETYYGSGEAERDDKTTSTMNTATATLSHRIDADRTVRNVLRYFDFTLDRNNTLYRSGSAYTLSGGELRMSRTHGHVQRDESGWFNQLELLDRVALGDTRHEILYGLEVGRQRKQLDIDNWIGIDTVPLFNPGGAVPPYTTVAPNSRTIGNVTEFSTAALYVQDQITLNPEWKALVGVRYDDFRQETSQPGKADLARTDREWSPRAGIVWQPDASQAYYASVSQAFQPSAEQFQLSTANVDNAPEISTNYEIGGKWEHAGGALSSGASLFHLARTDMKIGDPARPGRSINAGEQHTDGLELTLTGRPARGWQVHAGYAYLASEIVKSTASGGGNFGTTRVTTSFHGKDAALTPRHSAVLWLTRELGEGWSLGGGVHAQARQYAAPDNLVRLPGFAVADAALLYRSAAYDLSFNLKNVFDREYWATAHGSVNGLNQPGAPRTLQATVSHRF